MLELSWLSFRPTCVTISGNTWTSLLAQHIEDPSSFAEGRPPTTRAVGKTLSYLAGSHRSCVAAQKHFRDDCAFYAHQQEPVIADCFSPNEVDLRQTLSVAGLPRLARFVLWWQSYPLTLFLPFTPFTAISIRLASSCSCFLVFLFEFFVL